MITDELGALIRDAIEAAAAQGQLDVDASQVEIALEPPRNRQFGDFASNVALILAGKVGMPPREVAKRIAERIEVGSSVIEQVDIAGPGFLNFRLKPTWLHDTLLAVEQADEAYGHNGSRTGERVLIEFVSANPTGPISVVNGRAAALGDTLGNLLAASGAYVEREYYINDALNSLQLDHLAASLIARYAQQLGLDWPMPEDGYQGEYVADIARDLAAEHGDALISVPEPERSRRFRDLATSRMIDQQRRDLEAFGVRYDRWFYESSLYENSAVRMAIDEMKARGHAYEKDGALWLRTTELAGDDQDRVLVRSNDRETYVAADAAYHKDKLDRGFNRLIDVWGADHHGYVARLKAGIAALGYDPACCEMVLTQMVLLVRDGEPVKGSKRAGDIIPLADLVGEIGRDAARFHFLLNSYETTATFDMELAKRQSNENPVYYAQYAHARCCNVFRRAVELGVAARPASEVDLRLLVAQKELDLLRKLSEYPGEVKAAGDTIAPHRLTALVREIGQALHQFYEDCPALKDGVPPDLRDARLALFNATRIVVRNLLALLGVSAPDRM